MLEGLLRTVRIGLGYRNARKGFLRSRSSLERFQEKSVRSHLRYVMAHSGYYRELFQGKELSDWRSFPVTDKQAMMTNFDRYNTLGIGREEALSIARKGEQTRDFRPTLRGATVGLSSGTTGSYSLFLSSAEENAAFIGMALARLLRGGIIDSHRIAFFHRAHSNLYQGLDSGRLRHRFFDLSHDLESEFESLEELNPTQIIGPPFLLRRLGEAVKGGRLSLRPKALLSVAEVLDDADRRRISGDFGLSVDEAYIATEGFIAATCRYGSLHVNEDCLVMQREWLDRDSGRFIPIITDFRRRIQPIIRYRLDDVLVDGDAPCKCGSAFAILQRVEGRCDDVLVARTREGEQLRRIFPDFVRRALCTASEDIQDYRVTQNSMDNILVSLDTSAEHRRQCEQDALGALHAMFDGMGCKSPEIAFECSDPAALQLSSTKVKVRRVVRNFPTPLT